MGTGSSFLSAVSLQTGEAALRDVFVCRGRPGLDFTLSLSKGRELPQSLRGSRRARKQFVRKTSSVSLPRSPLFPQQYRSRAGTFRRVPQNRRDSRASRGLSLLVGDVRINALPCRLSANDYHGITVELVNGEAILQPSFRESFDERRPQSLRQLTPRFQIIR